MGSFFFFFEYTSVYYICFHKYILISYFIKWNEIVFLSNILLRLYFNIICKNIVNFFQKFEVGYTQTCTPLESSTMWHLKGCHHSVLSLVCSIPISKISTKPIFNSYFILGAWNQNFQFYLSFWILTQH